MAGMDINYQCLKIHHTIESKELPAFVISAATRKPQRIRANDTIFALFSLSSGEETSAQKVRGVLNQMPELYFNSRGSVTASQRLIAEKINAELLGINRRLDKSSPPVTGSLSLGVLHNESLYLLQVGEAGCLLLGSAESSNIHTPQESFYNLGISSRVNAVLHQVQVKKGEFVLVYSQPRGRPGVEFSDRTGSFTHYQIRRNILNQNLNQFEGLVFQFVTGKGLIHHIIPGRPIQDAPAEDDLRSPVRKMPEYDRTTIRPRLSERPLEQPAQLTEPSPQETLRESKPLVGKGEDGIREIPETTAVKLNSGSRKIFPRLPQFNPGTRLKYVFSRLKIANLEQKPLTFPPGLKRKMASVWFSGKKAAGRIEEGTQVAGKHLLPTRDELGGSFSRLTMLIIAIAVPIIIVAVASTVYIRSGHDELYTLYAQQAQVYAEQAISASDASSQRNAWIQTLYWVERAESYSQTNSLDNLRIQAQNALDSMEGISRVSLRPAMTAALPGDANIIRVVANRNDLYLLDSTTGEILRLFLTGRGYELDDSFICKPGPSGAIQIQPLVDMAILPVNNIFKAVLMAVDSGGNLIYCIPGENPISNRLTPPDANWGQISGIDFQQDILYILDPPSNAVWYYRGSNLNFSEEPRLYFDKSIPILSNAADFFVSGENLYILHQDGKMTLCTFRIFSGDETKCTDPFFYGDNRDGLSKELLVFEGTQFTQMVNTQMPDSSIYILDVSQPSIYHFSLRLNLQRLLLPLPDRSYQLPDKPVTAFTISQNRVLFMAYRNEVFYAPVP